MALLGLRYGGDELGFSFESDKFDVLKLSSNTHPLTDIELGAIFDQPIGSPPLEELVNAGESVLLVVPDATRRTAAGQIANLIVRRLIASGIMPQDIAAIFATGIHRPVTESERKEILTPFLVQRLRVIDHDATNKIKLFGHGNTSSGIPVELNWALTEFDHIVLIGGVSFHYFAGFTGGRKLICPGLASEKTIAETHKLAFDCKTMQRREGVGTGILQGNAVHEAFVEAANKIKVSFAVNAIVDEHGRAVEVFCGEMNASHLAACESYRHQNTIRIAQKRDVVIASCGGSPFDINVIQAHKALDAAANACKDGGVIILIAECGEGFGKPSMAEWFASGTSEKIAQKLCESYEVNGQTAWSFRKKTEKFDVRMVTALDETTVALLGAKKASSINEALADIDIKNDAGYIIPNASKALLMPTIA